MGDTQPAGASYIVRQVVNDIDYEQAWKDAPEEFKEAAAKLGLHVYKEDHKSTAVPYDSEYSSTDTPYNPDFASRAYVPDMASCVDDYVDEVIENIGIKFAPFVRFIANLLKRPMEQELIRNRSHLLARVSAYLVADENGKEKSNALARIHALLHSIPRFASENGYSSMRASAIACGVSPEWMRRSRDKCCDLLEIPVPAHGQKSKEAKMKYKRNAHTNHWRSKKFVAPTKKI
jgi:hypothetical protein